MKKGDRKTRIEVTVDHMGPMTHHEAALAWERLRLKLDAMTEPTARPPRFNGLLMAIYSAASNNHDGPAAASRIPSVSVPP